jgi:M6 family metalloprotease-like protein
MKKLLTLLFICTISFQVFAIPADPKPSITIQPNGEILTVYQKGDEYINWAETEDGYTLLINSDYTWCYAQLDENGDMIPSPFYATDFAYRTPEVTEWLQNIDKFLFYSREQVSYYMQFREMAEAEEAKIRGSIMATGQRRLLVILMEFPDKPFKKTVEDFDMLLNQINYNRDRHIGSMRDFYLVNSYNKFEVISHVVGPYKAKNNSSYYGGAGNPNPRILAQEAIQAAHNAGVNFKIFAQGNTISSFYVVYAGLDRSNASSCSTCIWAHQGYLITPMTFQGLQVHRYACSSELAGSTPTSNTLSTVGVFCHEYGHSLGTPDYYDTNYEEGGLYSGTGQWDIMAAGTHISGGRAPATHNPRSKINAWPWAQAITLDYPQTVTVPAGRIYQNAYFKVYPPVPANPAQFFFLEYKKRQGFDIGIPGEGLLIYRLTEPYEQQANTTHPQRFYPVVASANFNVPSGPSNEYGNINSSGCPWPYFDKTDFNDSSIPGMITWDKLPFLRPITNIVKHDDYVTFDFMGGGPKQNFHVFLPTLNGLTSTPASGSISPVAPGGSFAFKITVRNHCSFSAITANGVILTPVEGVYTISNIQADQIVRIVEWNSIKEIEDRKEKISVYPNPTTGKLVITNYELRITGIDVLDVTGKTVASHQQISPSFYHQIDISHLAAGFYMVRIQTDKGVVTKKVVKE